MSKRLARFMEEIKRFDPVIIYRPGRLQTFPGALSTMLGVREEGNPADTAFLAMQEEDEEEAPELIPDDEEEESSWEIWEKEVEGEGNELRKGKKQAALLAIKQDVEEEEEMPELISDDDEEKKESSRKRSGASKNDPELIPDDDDDDDEEEKGSSKRKKRTVEFYENMMRFLELDMENGIYMLR
jgi:hypothetical protein